MSTTGAPRSPSGLPRLVVLLTGDAANHTTLTAIDRRTHRRVVLVGPAAPPPAATSAWRIDGFDLGPNANELAYSVATAASRRSVVYIASVDASTRPRRVGYGTVERFSPDDRWLLVADRTWVALPVGGGTPIRSDAVSPYLAEGVQWSPDGSEIALGEHFERNSPLVTSLLRFDATRRTLTSVDALRVNGGTRPWWTPDQRLHTISDAGLACTGPVDVDASFRWALSESRDCSTLTWWNTGSGPHSAQPLDVTLPGEQLLGAAW